MKKLILVTALIIASTVVGGITAYGDTYIEPVPFEIWSEDGMFVFRWEPTERANTARAGVYRNDELIYSVANLPAMGESANNFFFSEDMRHFAFRPTTRHGFALGFFEDGILTQTYRISELVQDMSVVSNTVTMAFWENRRYFDSTNNTLTIVTRDGITYVFDIITGQIIYSSTWYTPPVEPLLTDPTLSSWAQMDVSIAVSQGIVPEHLMSNFNQPITRAEFVDIVIQLYSIFMGGVIGTDEIPALERELLERIDPFSDTDSFSVLFEEYLGLITGLGDGQFDPESSLTREQAAVILARLVGILLENPQHPYELINFNDAVQLSERATYAINKMQSMGIMGSIGDNRFAPQSAYTREQSIVTLYRIFTLWHEEMNDRFYYRLNES